MGLNSDAGQQEASPLNEPTRIQAMVASLKALLDQVPNARQVLPHLAALEVDLANHGLLVVQRAPIHALIRASQELALLPMQQDDAPLQDLGTVLLGELESRAQPRSHFLSTFVSPDKLVVSEGSHTEFMAASGLLEPKQP